MDWNKGGDSRDERLAAIDTQPILAAVDAIDALREHFGDHGPALPPRIRFDLLTLHRLMQEAATGARDNTPLYDLAIDLADRIDAIETHVAQLRRAVDPISALAPDD
ncbi:hypothetical protein ACWGNZ_23090 (plasmid) [Sphingomonas zeae]|jgi:hypothetical protein